MPAPSNLEYYKQMLVIGPSLTPHGFGSARGAGLYIFLSCRQVF